MAGLTRLTDIFLKKPKHAEVSPVQASPAASVPKVRIVFMGTPTLSQELLATLLQADYQVVGIVTKPDKKIGREQTLSPSPVKRLAESQGIPVLTPKKLDDTFVHDLAAWKPDLILVAAYGKILPEKVLALPGLGCINVHYSLLPRFRGASPIQHALLFGDSETGVTLQKMDAGLDTGDIIAAQTVAIAPTDTTQTLTPKLNAAAKELLLHTLPLWIKQKITPVPQKHEEAVLCQLIERADGKIEWDQEAQAIYNRFRAFDPWPGIFTYWKKGDSFVRLKLIEIELASLPSAQTHSLGEVFPLADTIAVQTGAGAIILHTLQVEGKKRMEVADFVRGNPDFIGSTLA